jgi:hypothetical protein
MLLMYAAAVEYELQVHTQDSKDAGTLLSMSVDFDYVHYDKIESATSTRIGGRTMLTGFTQAAQPFAAGNTAVFQFMANNVSFSEDQPLVSYAEPNPAFGAFKIVVA